MNKLHLFLIGILLGTVSPNTFVYALTPEQVTSPEERPLFDHLTSAAAELVVNKGKTIEAASTQVADWASWKMEKAGVVTSSQLKETIADVIKRKVEKIESTPPKKIP